MLALAPGIGCNAQSFNSREHFPMHVKRRRPLPNFDACSVALFTTLAVGGAAFPARAQTPSSPSPPPSTSSVPSAQRASPFQIGPLTPASGTGTTTSARWTPEARAQSFKSADKNGDGQLSRQEAGAVPSLPRSFEQMDSNKDGSISSAEFDESLK